MLDIEGRRALINVLLLQIGIDSSFVCAERRVVVLADSLLEGITRQRIPLARS